MKKKGMIPEHHRKASEEKWAKIIKAIDEGWEYDDVFGGLYQEEECMCLPYSDASVEILRVCGYCETAGFDDELDRLDCNICFIPTWICADCAEKGLIADIIKDLGNGKRAAARRKMVKIHDYIKNDKPGD